MPRAKAVTEPEVKRVSYLDPERTRAHRRPPDVP